MQVSPTGADSATVAIPGLPARLCVSGIAASELAELLAGRARPKDWLKRVGRPPIQVALENESALAGGEETVQDLEDGRVVMRSGAPAAVAVEPEHRAPGFLLPESLRLAMSQQWARAGAIPVHGAVIVSGSVSVLVIGPKAAGKSILSAAALAAGLSLVSDDWVLLGKDDQTRPGVWRMRRFVMLREGWAANQLMALLPDIHFQHAGRPKRVFHLPEEADERFPARTHINRIWLLERPGGSRRQHTTIEPAPSAAALASLIEASMPLFFGSAFPHERQRLMATARDLLKDCECFRVVTGTELVERPGGLLELLGR